MDFANSVLSKLGWTKSSSPDNKEEIQKPKAVSEPSEWAKDKDEEDRVESLIRGSGCWDNHIQVVQCMSEHGDWRKCQEQLSQFKTCMRPSQDKNSAAVGSISEGNRQK